MDVTALGGSGLRVSRLGLGTLNFGGTANGDPADCAYIIHRALDAGITLVDTADSYWAGETEAIVGAALKGRRNRVVLATKAYFPMGADPNQRGGSRRWIVEAVDASLRRLGTDWIDLYQLHRWDRQTDVEEVLFTFTDLVRAGKIRSFGSSMAPADRLIEARWTAQRRKTLRLQSDQLQYSLFAREAERFRLPALRRLGMAALAYQPLDEGWLSGRYRSGADFAATSRLVRGRSFRSRDPIVLRKLALVADLSRVADDAGVTLPQLAVAFTLEHPAVAATIIGPRTLDQFEGLLPAARLRLAQEALDRIDALLPPGTSVAPTVDIPAEAVASKMRRT